MKKAAAQVCLILRGILFIGFSIQIILGLVWMCFHFMELQEFAQVRIGVYPLLVRMVGSLPQVLYLLQLMAAFGAGWHFLRVLGVVHRFWRGWGTFILLSLPMAMQCHLALLPYSFVSSLIFLELGFCTQAVAEAQVLSLRKMALAGSCALGLTLLLPEYAWLGMIPLVLILLVRLKAIWKNLRQLLYSCLLVAAFCGMAGALGSLSPSEDDCPRHVWLSIASRTAWPTFWNDSEHWSEELYGLVGEMAWDVAVRPGNMEKILQPFLERTVGAEREEKYYREMAATAWKRHRNQILKQIVWDVLTYEAPQAVLQMQLEGRAYDSASGRNYEIMLMRHPQMTKYYVTYGCWWFWVSLGIAVLQLLIYFVVRGRSYSRGCLTIAAIAVLWMAVVVLYYTLQGAGIADYKCTVAAAQLWAVLAIVSCQGQAFFPQL